MINNMQNDTFSIRRRLVGSGTLVAPAIKTL